MQSCEPFDYMASDESAWLNEVFSGAPLCELHLHLEGSVDPATLRLLDSSLGREEAEQPYRFSSFSRLHRELQVHRATAADAGRLCASRQEAGGSASGTGGGIRGGDAVGRGAVVEGTRDCRIL